MQLTDDLARITLIVGFVLVVPVGIYHRMRSRTEATTDMAKATQKQFEHGET